MADGVFDRVPVELLDQILRAVDEPKTLAQCVRVNSCWFERAVPLLWRGDWRGPIRFHSKWSSPSEITLCRLSRNEDRFRFYMKHVRFLCFRRAAVTSAGATERWNRRLWTPNRHLAATLFLHSRLTCEDDLESFLQTYLRTLVLDCWSVTDRLLTVIKCSSPNLQLLQFGASIDTLRPEAFADFLDEMPQLRSLTLLKRGPDPAAVMDLPNLEHLEIVKTTLADFADFAVSKNRLRNLRSIKLKYVDRVFINTILPWLTELESFVTMMYSNTHPNFEYSGPNTYIEDFSGLLLSLSKCQQLSYITISTDYWNRITPEDLIELARGCPSLRKIEFRDVAEERHRETPILPAGYLNKFTKPLSQLEELFICVQAETTPEDLLAIGRNCPRLRQLHLNTHVELLELSRISADTPIFPCLESLGLDYVFVKSHQHWASDQTDVLASDEARRLVEKHMPRLRKLRLAGGWIDPTVRDAISTVLGRTIDKSNQSIQSNIPSLEDQIRADILGIRGDEFHRP